MMKLNCKLSVWQKPKEFFFQILSFLWKGHNKRLRGQTIDAKDSMGPPKETTFSAEFCNEYYSIYLHTKNNYI